MIVTVSHTGSGGVLHFLEQSIITIEASVFDDNSASDIGGVLNFTSGILVIEASEFDGNSAKWGGVLYFGDSTISIKGSELIATVPPRLEECCIPLLALSQLVIVTSPITAHQ